MGILSDIAKWICPVGLSRIGRRDAERGKIILSLVDRVGELEDDLRKTRADNAALNEQISRCLTYKDAQLHDLRAELTTARGEHAAEIQTLRDQRDDAIKALAELKNPPRGAKGRFRRRAPKPLDPSWGPPGSVRFVSIVGAILLGLAIAAGIDRAVMAQSAELPSDTTVIEEDDGDELPAEPTPINGDSGREC